MEKKKKKDKMGKEPNHGLRRAGVQTWSRSDGFCLDHSTWYIVAPALVPTILRAV